MLASSDKAKTADQQQVQEQMPKTGIEEDDELLDEFEQLDEDKKRLSIRNELKEHNK